MPLFGSNKHADGYEQSGLTGASNTHTGLTGTDHSHHQTGLGSNTHGTHTGAHTGGTGPGGFSAPGVGTGTGIGHGLGHDQPHSTGLGHNQHTMGTTAPTHHTGATHNVGTGMHTQAADHTMIPAHGGSAATGHNSTSHSQPGKGTEIVGKLEHAVGTLVGSQSMKMKGAQKEHAAHNSKLQNLELSEAERLEHEAGLRRERAANYGAGTHSGVPPQHHGGTGGVGGIGPAGGSAY